jgi:hypothetical protein
MAVIYASSLRTTRITAVLTAIDADASPGTLEIGTASMASTLAVLTLADPAGTVAGDVLTLDCSPALSDASANNTGTAAAARIKDGAGNVIVSGLTVGTSGTNIVLNTTSIVSGQVVEITSATITHNTAG